MNQLIAAKHTAVDLIPIGRRLAEIMKEKGMSHTITAMAKRLGWSRETYRLMLQGEREIYTFELEKIAQDFKLSVERIMQEDIRVQAEVVGNWICDQSDSNLADEYANHISDVAVGMTERCCALRREGLTYFYYGRYEEAHRKYFDAHHYALMIQEQYGETEHLYRVLLNIMDGFMAQKPAPGRMAAIYSFHAKMREALLGLDDAREIAYITLAQAEQSGSRIQIGLASNNVAHYEYKLQKYNLAAQFQQRAVELLESHQRYQQLAKKEYIKTLIQLGETERALELIESMLQDAATLESPMIEGRLLMLRTVVTNDLQHAQYVVEQERFDEKVRELACKLLMEQAKERGDAALFMQYYQLAQQFMEAAPRFLEEEDL
ncbi:MAG: helix-turn-helix domain-containing protein [Tumebacillaceae bacterium]